MLLNVYYWYKCGLLYSISYSIIFESNVTLINRKINTLYIVLEVLSYSKFQKRSSWRALTKLQIHFASFLCEKYYKIIFKRELTSCDNTRALLDVSGAFRKVLANFYTIREEMRYVCECYLKLISYKKSMLSLYKNIL